MMNKRDEIDIEIRNFRLRRNTLPSFIIINRDDYWLLKEELGVPAEREIERFVGCDLLITMDLKKEIEIRI